MKHHIKNFYILTNTIDFKRYTIINDRGEDVINLPDNVTINPRKIDFRTTTDSVVANVLTTNWYRQNLLKEIMLAEEQVIQTDFIRYDVPTKTLVVSSNRIPCDMIVGNHKITFKTNSSSTPVSPTVPIGKTIAVFFVYDEDTIFLTYTNPSYYSIFRIAVSLRTGVRTGTDVEENIVFTRNNSIDTPFYYIETSVNDPTRPYLEIDEMVNRSLLSISVATDKRWRVAYI
jgi:hypothetical protein